MAIFGAIVDAVKNIGGVLLGEIKEKFGIGDTPDTTPELTSFDSYKDMTQFRAKPENLRTQVANVIRDDIKAGVLDKEKIRADVKNYIKQQINTEIIKKVTPPPQKSIGGFIANAKQDAEEIITGIGALLGLGVKAAFNPIDTIKGTSNFSKNMILSPAYRNEVWQTYGKPIVEEYKEYRHPLTKAYEDPLDVFLDITAIFSRGATAVGKAGLKTASKVLRESSTVASIKNVRKSTRGLVGLLPGGKDMLKNLDIAAQTRKMLSKEQTSFLVARQKVINEIDVKISKLTQEEVRALPLTVEGFVLPPQGASPAFYEATGMVRALADDQARFGLDIGKLTPEIIERRRFQPLADRKSTRLNSSH